MIAAACAWAGLFVQIRWLDSVLFGYYSAMFSDSTPTPRRLTMAQLRCLAEMERQLEHEDPELVAAIRRGRFRSGRPGPLALVGLSVVCVVVIGLAFALGGLGAGIATGASFLLSTCVVAIPYGWRRAHRHHSPRG